MELIEDLGVIAIKEGSRPRRYGIYKCPACGNPIKAITSAIKAGTITTCKDCRVKKVSKVNTTHGDSDSPLYKVWTAILQRCNNKDNVSYCNYGARGIRVEWDSYEEFKEWALNNGYTTGLSIERLDVNSNYCSNNCTFIPMSEQPSNTRRSIKNRFTEDDLRNMYEEFNSTCRSVRDTLKKYNISPKTFYNIKKGAYNGTFINSYSNIQ